MGMRAPMMFCVLAVGAAGCSTSGNMGGTTGGNFTVTIDSTRTFSPDPLIVPAGATVTFKNTDTSLHTATSEPSAGSYDAGQAPGGFTFDTGSIAGSNGTAMITIPATVASGAIQPYFCGNHQSMMMNPNPTIHIR
jgi:plastocyanin